MFTFRPSVTGMVLSCFVNGCTNYGYKKDGISYHRFPAILHHKGDAKYELTRERRRRWIAAVNRKKTQHSILLFAQNILYRENLPHCLTKVIQIGYQAYYLVMRLRLTIP